MLAFCVAANFAAMRGGKFGVGRSANRASGATFGTAWAAARVERRWRKQAWRSGAGRQSSGVYSITQYGGGGK